MKSFVIWCVVLGVWCAGFYSRALADYSRGMEYFRKANKAFQSQRLDEALKLVQSAIEEDPSNAQSLALQGDIYYNMQKLGLAKTSWESALNLNPQLDVVRGKIKRLEVEAAVEDRLEADSESIFQLRSESSVIDSHSRAAILGYLRAAYQAIGADFNYFPRHKVIVLLYSPADFAKVREVPDCVLGLYDGKIRIPLREEVIGDLLVLKKIIWHEYTHSLIYDISRAKCPVFLNEGLGVYEGSRAGKGPDTALRQAVKENKLAPLISYFSSYAQFKGGLTLNAELFYLQSESLVNYMLSIWGWTGMNRLLSDIATSPSWTDSLRAILKVEPQDLEKRWMRWVRELYKGG